jgi:alpha-L-fucosidase 2
MVPRIAPNQIGKHGQLQEWLEDKDDPDNHHRHVSHLWGVHPGHEINWDKTPELMKAARQSLVFRGDEGTGWSLAWKINFWSRFREGDRAYDLIHMLLSPAGAPGRKIRGGSYPNLFDAHPPFQIDGNFGGAAGIVETLIQSHLGYIDLLPALPDNLREGEIKGVCARGGFELSFAWNSGKLQQVEVLSKAGEPCKLKYGKNEVEFETRKGERYRFNGKLRKR